MKTPGKLFVGFVVVAALLGLWWILAWSQGGETSRCEVCSRPMHAPTAFSLLRNGEQVWACCPRCGLSILRAGKIASPHATATDYPTGKRFAAETGFYVEGSDLAPCCSPDIIVGETKHPCGKCFDRCYPSVIAFAKADAALAFTKQHGGTVVAFETLMRELKKP